MSTQTETAPFARPFQADPVHSSFGFAVRHMGVSAFRGTLNDVEASVRPIDTGLLVEGVARVESISIQNPPELRGHVLGEEFFDAEHHPEIAFRSGDVQLAEDGSATLQGDLTIRGVTRPVTTTGKWVAPRQTPGGLRGALELETTVDRRQFDLNWQMEAPDGGLALDWDVTITAHLELVAEEDE
jgi:polyisoprenoid-binding protein YceI